MLKTVRIYFQHPRGRELSFQMRIRDIEFERLHTSVLTVLYLFYEILGHQVAILRGGIVT